MKKQINIIGAISNNNIIGLNNKLPWYKSQDLKYFKKITIGKNSLKKNAIIMGFNTWNSINNKQLSKRINIVIDKNIKQPSILMNLLNKKNNNEWYEKYINSNNPLFINNLDEAILFCKMNEYINDTWIIGGEDIYNKAINNNNINNIYLTKINEDILLPFKEQDTAGRSPACGTLRVPPSINTKYFPNIPNNYKLISNIKCKKDKSLNYLIYNNNNNNIEEYDDLYLNKNEEYQYLNLIKKILEKGVKKDDRTQSGITSYFGEQMRFNLNNTFPLLTTKKVHLKSVIEELLWFLNGKTDVTLLKEKNVNIWNKNTSREYLDNMGLYHLNENDGGPIYGFNFRHFGAKYIDCKTNYTNQGFDQIEYVINELKNNPNSKRILINLWNPNDLNKVSLPACHVLYQFWVNDNKLSCLMYQRSADVGLGMPFNIASASLLTYILGKLTNLKPYELIYSVGDAHIYNNHIKQLEKQIKNIPYEFPTLQIKDRNQTKIEDFIYDDFILENYHHHKSIKMDMY